MVRISLLELQRMIDLSRIDPTQPIDLSTICNTGLFKVDADNDRHYGFHLTEDVGVKFNALTLNSFTPI